jgi:hypothetical protein
VITAILGVKEHKDLRCISAHVRGRGLCAAHVEEDVPIPSAPATATGQASRDDAFMQTDASSRLIEHIRLPARKRLGET